MKMKINNKMILIFLLLFTMVLGIGLAKYPPTYFEGF